MKKSFFAAGAALMLIACNKQTDLTVYNGDYNLDNNTTITVNGQNVQMSYFESPEVSITVLDNGNCEITLTNMIAGQQTLTLSGTISETKTAAGAAFAGSANTADRTVSVEGTTGESAIASINISEEITVEGLAGQWNFNHITLSFRHPDFTTIDLSTILPELGEMSISDLMEMLSGMLNNILEENKPFTDPDLVLTENGDCIYGDSGIPMSYYVRPDESTLYIFIRKYVMDMMSEEIKNDSDIMSIISMLGMTSLVENTQSVNIPIQYSISDGTLSLTATQSIVEPYESMLAQPVETIEGLINMLTYEVVSGLLADTPEIAQFITAENFPVIKQMLLDAITALTDGQAEYSVTTELVPFAG